MINHNNISKRAAAEAAISSMDLHISRKEANLREYAKKAGAKQGYVDSQMETINHWLAVKSSLQDMIDEQDIQLHIALVSNGNKDLHIKILGSEIEKLMRVDMLTKAKL